MSKKIFYGHLSTLYALTKMYLASKTNLNFIYQTVRIKPEDTRIPWRPRPFKLDIIYYTSMCRHAYIHITYTMIGLQIIRLFTGQIIISNFHTVLLLLYGISEYSVLTIFLG